MVMMMVEEEAEEKNKGEEEADDDDDQRGVGSNSRSHGMRVVGSWGASWSKVLLQD